jgi:hypothetical protein
VSFACAGNPTHSDSRLRARNASGRPSVVIIS